MTPEQAIEVINSLDYIKAVLTGVCIMLGFLIGDIVFRK